MAGWSAVLGLELRPEGGRLRLYAPALDEFLLSHGEAVAQRDAAKSERDAESVARRAAEARVAELERRLAERE